MERDDFQNVFQAQTMYLRKAMARQFARLITAFSVIGITGTR